MANKKPATAVPTLLEGDVVQLTLHHANYLLIPEDKRKAIEQMASEIPLTENLVVMRFKRDRWFHLCGEIYALLCLRIELILEFPRVVHAGRRGRKGGAA